MLKWSKIFIACSFLTIGCADVQKFVDNTVVKSVQNKEAEDVSNAMSEMTERDVVVIYKEFTGLAEFLENTDYIKSTLKIDDTISKFYGVYNISKPNEKWFNFIESWLNNRGYNNPKAIVESVSDETKEISKRQVISDFRILAEGAKMNLEKRRGRN